MPAAPMRSNGASDSKFSVAPSRFRQSPLRIKPVPPRPAVASVPSVDANGGPRDRGRLRRVRGTAGDGIYRVSKKPRKLVEKVKRTRSSERELAAIQLHPDFHQGYDEGLAAVRKNVACPRFRHTYDACPNTRLEEGYRLGVSAALTLLGIGAPSGLL